MRPVIPFFSCFPSFKILLGQILEAYFAAFALCNIGGFSPAGILSAVLFALVFCFFSFCRRQREKNAAALPRLFDPVCRLLAVLYTLLYVAAQHQNLTGGFDSRLFRFGFVAATAAGLYFLFAACCRALMLLLASRRPRLSTAPLSGRQKALCFFLLLLCWLPWFLYDYPGVMTPDSLSQFSQATGLTAYSDHHPLLHTLLFEALYRIGFFLTRNVYMGIAAYTLFQMAVLAGVETFCLSVLSRLGAPRLLLAGWLAFWGLLPYNGIFAVTLWKDVLFSAFLLLIRGKKAFLFHPVEQFDFIVPVIDFFTPDLFMGDPATGKPYTPLLWYFIPMYLLIALLSFAAMALADRVEQGAYIILAGDRTPIGSEKAVAEVDFLGAKAPFPTGGALLALLLKCPLRMMTCTRRASISGDPAGSARYRVKFASLDESPAAPRREREAWLKRMAQAYADNLAAEILRSPRDWFNFYDFWGESQSDETVCGRRRKGLN